MTTGIKKKGGPNTEEGKRRSSLNALKHGLDAKSPQFYEIIAKQTEAEYSDIYMDMYRYFCPIDPVEEQLVRRLARCIWRLNISASMEKRMLDRGSNITRPAVSYDRILRYERLVDIHFYRALATLMRIRESRNKKMDETNSH